jgi:hypothetical protein
MELGYSTAVILRWRMAGWMGVMPESRGMFGHDERFEGKLGRLSNI